MNDADKPELNPYESPREPELLRVGQIVKRTIGVGTIILLTPPAMIIAGGVSCGASILTRQALLIPLVSAGLPIALLFGLMGWAISIDRRERNAAKRDSRRAVLLAQVAPTVTLAAIFGVILAFGAFVAINEAMGVGIAPGLFAGVIIFGAAPFLTLLVMLCRAWWAS
jgi:hypothetical protein